MRRRVELLAAFALAGCAGGEAEPSTRSDASEPAREPAREVASSASSEPKDEPNRPAFDASARVKDDASAASASAAVEPSPLLAMENCEPKTPPAGWENCEAIEVIGGAPCELECWRERKVTAKTACCDAPVRGAIFGKNGALVEADACAHVDPSCAHSSNNIQSAEVGFHFFSDSNPREVLLVQGGCEMRAMGHGYVPSGVAAWTGCAVAKRFRWNGTRFALVR